MSNFKTCFESNACKKDGIRFGTKVTLGNCTFKVIGYNAQSDQYSCRSLTTGEVYLLSAKQIKK